MKWLRRFWTTIRPRRLDSDLDAEIASHLDQRAEDNIAAGMSAEEAWREAQIRFGNQTLLKESTRETEILVWLQTALQDVRYGLRGVRMSPGFTATAILSLALGIGANTALFSLLDTLLLKSLPVRDPEQLVVLGTVEDGKTQTGGFSVPQFEALRDQAAHGDAAASAQIARSILERGAETPALVEAVSGEYFDVLGVEAWRGRMIQPADNAPGSGVAVVSEAFLKAHRVAIGSHFRVRDGDFTVIGVAPASFHGLSVDRRTDVWVPVRSVLAPDSYMLGADWGWLEIIVRLHEPLGAFQAQAGVILPRFWEQTADRFRFVGKMRTGFLARRVKVIPGANGISRLRERFAKPLLVIEALAGFVLLIACVNLANLMLARTSSRQREIATRRALGASRGRLIRQLLTESVLITFAGFSAALVTARWLSTALLHFLQPDDPALLILRFHLDWRILLFSGGLAAITCMLFGLLPALRATHVSFNAGRDSMGLVLIGGEVALCTVILIGSGLLVRTLLRLDSLDPGFARDHILVGYADVPHEYSKEQAHERMDELVRRISALPEVRSVSRSVSLLMIGDRITFQIHVPGGPASDASGITMLSVSPDFFATMGTPMLLGRDFTARDNAAALPVAIVNEAFARRFFKGRNPIGLHFGREKETYQVVGLVKDAKYKDLREDPPPIFYRPAWQTDNGVASAIEIRAQGDLTALTAALSETARQVDPRMKMRQVAPFHEVIDRTLATEKMVAQISAVFGALALVAACVGFYGILAYRVVRRTKEIGVRMALGATQNRVVWLVMRESLAMLVVGFAVGVPVALVLTRFLSTLLYGLAPDDPSTIAIAFGALGVVSILAAWIPARRAARVDPMMALRCD
jgi:predicted permease